MTAATHVTVIAEAGVNHNGDVEKALALVDAAADAGADIIKFQTFRASDLVTARAPTAAYQERNTEGETSQLAMLTRLQLDAAAHETLLQRCAERGVEFLSTPFDDRSADLLADQLKLRRLKVSSGDLNNAPFLHYLARKRVPLILSTGMATLADIEEALGVVAHGFLHPDEPPALSAFRQAYRSDAGQKALADRVTLLHCTSEYPCAPDDVNLRAMQTMRTAFNLTTGYSDHTEGIAVPVAAVALGAEVIEKHFTLDRALPGPDHKASLEPDELADMVASIRVVEASLGRALKAPSEAEVATQKVVGKTIVAARPIARGESFSETNLTVKRAGEGVAPIRFWSLIGTAATRDYQPDEAILP